MKPTDCDVVTLNKSLWKLVTKPTFLTPLLQDIINQEKYLLSSYKYSLQSDVVCISRSITIIYNVSGVKC